MKQGTVVKTWKTRSGKQATLRVLKKSDFEDLLRYANALIDEDTFIMLSGKHLGRREEREYVNDSLKKVARDEKIHLVAHVDGQFAGSCEVRRFVRRKRSAGEIGISIAGDFRGEGIGYVCMTELIAQAKRIGLRLLYLHVFENNERAIHLYEKAGFRVSGTVPAMYEYKGGFVGETTMYLPLIS